MQQPPASFVTSRSSKIARPLSLAQLFESAGLFSDTKRTYVVINALLTLSTRRPLTMPNLVKLDTVSLIYKWYFATKAYCRLNLRTAVENIRMCFVLLIKESLHCSPHCVCTYSSFDSVLRQLNALVTHLALPAFCVCIFSWVPSASFRPIFLLHTSPNCFSISSVTTLSAISCQTFSPRAMFSVYYISFNPSRSNLFFSNIYKSIQF